MVAEDAAAAGTLLICLVAVVATPWPVFSLASLEKQEPMATVTKACVSEYVYRNRYKDMSAPVSNESFLQAPTTNE